MGTVEIIFSIQQHEALSCSQLSLLPLSRQNLRPMPTMDMEAMVDTVMAVMDTVDTVERDLLMPMPTMDMEVMEDMDVVMGMVVMDMDVVMDMAVTDTVDTVERDPLSHTTDMVDTVDTEDTDMAVVMATDMAVNSYFQEAKRFYYLIFKIDV